MSSAWVLIMHRLMYICFCFLVRETVSESQAASNTTSKTDLSNIDNICFEDVINNIYRKKVFWYRNSIPEFTLIYIWCFILSNMGNLWLRNSFACSNLQNHMLHKDGGYKDRPISAYNLVPIFCLICSPIWLLQHAIQDFVQKVIFSEIHAIRSGWGTCLW